MCQKCQNVQNRPKMVKMGIFDKNDKNDHFWKNRQKVIDGLPQPKITKNAKSQKCQKRAKMALLALLVILRPPGHTPKMTIPGQIWPLPASGQVAQNPLFDQPLFWPLFCITPKNPVSKVATTVSEGSKMVQKWPFLAKNGPILGPLFWPLFPTLPLKCL